MARRTNTRRTKTTGGSWRDDHTLTDVDRQLIQKVEEIYGPTPPAWGGPRSRREVVIATLAKLRGRAGPPVARTLLLAAVAGAVGYYALISASDFSGWLDWHPLPSRTFTQDVTGQAPQVSAEYMLATLQRGRAVANDPLLVEFKRLLDEMAPKCKESRMQLANSVAQAHDALEQRGVRDSYLSILLQADYSLSEQTRPLWPTSCGAVIDAIVATRRTGK